MPILCYHSIRADWESPLAVRPDAFDQQMAFLAVNRDAVDLTTATEHMRPSGRLPRGMVSVTFDDGFVDNLEEALPILQRYGVPSTIFVVAATLTENQPVTWVDDPPPQPLQTLTRDQILALTEAGVTIGSHSLHHHNLPELSPAECLSDLAESRQVLEDLLRRPIDLLAYPRGLHNETVRTAAAAAGYRWSYALPTGPEEPGPHAIPRVGIYRHNDAARFRVKLAEWYRSARTSRLYARMRG